ncbi:MAG: chemotaxis response regulator protein-glutamate methylesterase [Pseudomonadota bacterium]
MPRVVIVDDSNIMRQLLARVLSQESNIEVIATAPDPNTARRVIRELSPDVITLDVEMPGMDGISFLKKIMTLRPMPVVMVSTLTDRGTETALSALELGAVDALPKPGGDLSLEAFGRALRSAVLAAARAKVTRASSPRASIESGPKTRPKLITLGASTGGVAALSEVLKGLGGDAPPVVIAQHMPESYVPRFAARLAHSLTRDVAVARAGEVLSDGMIRIAPGDAHLRVALNAGRLITSLSNAPPVNGHVPSVDVLFDSVAQISATCAAALLTGMGKDGAQGLLQLRQAGHRTIAQSEESCVVYGMPRAAAECGAAQTVADLGQIPELLFTLCKDCTPMMSPRPTRQSASHA